MPAEVNDGVPEVAVGPLINLTTALPLLPTPRRVGYTCIRLRMELMFSFTCKPISIVPLVVTVRSTALLSERAVTVPLSPPSM